MSEFREAMKKLKHVPDKDAPVKPVPMGWDNVALPKQVMDTLKQTRRGLV